MTALIGALGIITASAFTSWTTANNRVGAIDTKVQVIEEREENHYKQLREDFSRVESKLDKLIQTKERP